MIELEYGRLVVYLAGCIMIGMVLAYPVGLAVGGSDARRQHLEEKMDTARRWQEIVMICTKDVRDAQAP